jgi:hypothetical protein
MTPSQIAESVRLAAEGIDALNANRYAVPRGWLPDDVRLVCESLMDMHAEVERMRAINTALTDVWATAATYGRRFPVPFDHHLRLVDAVDAARPLVDPPFDDDYDYDSARKGGAE